MPFGPVPHPRDPSAPFAGVPLLAASGDDLAIVLYFVGAEALAVFSAWALVAMERYSRARILELAEPRRGRAWALDHLNRIGTYDLTVRLTRFLANALLVIGITWPILRDHAADAPEWGRLPWGPLGIAIAVAFGLTFLVNDVVVRLLARRRPNRFLVRSFRILDALRVLTAPVRIPTALLAWVIFRVRLERTGPGAREELRLAVEEAEREGVFQGGEADMIEAILDLERRTVGDVLTVRGEAQMLRADATLSEAVAAARRTGHSRFPVYGRDKDDVLGYVSVRDLLAHAARGGESGARAADVAAKGPDGSLRVRDLMRPPFFVPHTKPVREVLDEMRRRRVHLALVTDEYGGTGGLVTIEDLLETIVGPIEDEYDADAISAPSGAQGKGGVLDVEGRTLIEEVNRALQVTLPIEEDFETVGGLVLHRLGKVPSTGEGLTLDNVQLTVTEADERTVKRLQVQLLPDRA